MASDWSTKRVLITVRTYPVPATKGIEVSCTAGVTSDGKWIRLFPVPYRFLSTDQRFTKYQWIDVDVTRASNDSRPESYKLNVDSIKIQSTVPSDDLWRPRKEIIFPLKQTSMCEIERHRAEHGSPTLGIFQPKRIKRLTITRAEAVDWTPDQQATLNQQLLPFETSTPASPLEKIPFEFRYEFQCDAPNCPGHHMSCTDWEIGQSYRKWRNDYGDGWEAKFREKYERQMIEKNDTHFYVGTLHQYPGTWIIVGLFYPPKPLINDLFG
jgi:hypothetical protein